MWEWLWNRLAALPLADVLLKKGVPASKLPSYNGEVEHLATVLAALLAGAGVTVLRRWHM